MCLHLQEVELKTLLYFFVVDLRKGTPPTSNAPDVVIMPSQLVNTNSQKDLNAQLVIFQFSRFKDTLMRHQGKWTMYSVCQWEIKSSEHI